MLRGAAEFGGMHFFPFSMFSGLKNAAGLKKWHYLYISGGRQVLGPGPWAVIKPLLKAESCTVTAHWPCGGDTSENGIQAFMHNRDPLFLKLSSRMAP